MCPASFSQAVVVDRTVYISGQLGLDVASGQLVDGGVQAQAKQVRLTWTDDADDDDGSSDDHNYDDVCGDGDEDGDKHDDFDEDDDCE